MSSAATAPDGTLGYWPEPSDVVASDPAKNTASTLVSPPGGWPKCFTENATLKGLLGKKGLQGKRCRLTARCDAETQRGFTPPVCERALRNVRYATFYETDCRLTNSRAQTKGC